jgi:hypothetical protein
MIFSFNIVPTFIIYIIFEFHVHGSVHRKSLSIFVQQDATVHSLLYLCKLLYMFRVVTPPIIRSTYTVITAPGTGQTVSATLRYGGEVGTAFPTSPS